MSVDTIVRIRTFAKLNLFLRVIGLRRDGFHEVETILHGIGLYDEIDIEPAESGIEVTMELVGGIAGAIPSKEENLIGRAARLLFDELNGVHGATVHVRKGIPIAAGLGGGSGNAAGALVTLAEMWGLQLERDRLLSIAERLGSDVPYCIDGGTALATARGEQLTPLPNIAPMNFVLGGTNHPLFTREVYELWDSLEPSEGFSAAALTLALGAGDATEVAALLHNDLERPAFSLRPELQQKKEALVDAGALGAAMSGSGPTMFAIAGSEDHAREIAGKVAKDFDWVKVVRSQDACIERLD
jgi:4-diphosphocytidyl-2-C-methyl-D-erythritol kinase